MFSPLRLDCTGLYTLCGTILWRNTKMHIYIYMYIYIKRERERNGKFITNNYIRHRAFSATDGVTGASRDVSPSLLVWDSCRNESKRRSGIRPWASNGRPTAIPRPTHGRPTANQHPSNKINKVFYDVGSRFGLILIVFAILWASQLRTQILHWFFIDLEWFLVSCLMICSYIFHLRTQHAKPLKNIVCARSLRVFTHQKKGFGWCSWFVSLSVWALILFILGIVLGSSLVPFGIFPSIIQHRVRTIFGAKMAPQIDPLVKHVRP